MDGSGLDTTLVLLVLRRGTGEGDIMRGGDLTHSAIGSEVGESANTGEGALNTVFVARAVV